MQTKYLEVLAITFILVSLHFVFSKIMAKVKPGNLRPPRQDEEVRRSSIYFISEDLVFLSVTFTFFFLNDLLYFVKTGQPIPNVIREASPYVLWFLILLTVVYVGCLSLNKEIDCLKWKLSRTPQTMTIKLRYYIFVMETLLLSVSAITATFFFTMRITLKTVW